MKVGIVTIIDHTNYGNRLQNYALEKVLKEKCDCEVLTLAPYSQKEFYNGNYIAWLKEEILKVICNFPKIAEKRFGNSVTRWANFEKWNKHIHTRNYYGNKELPQRVNEQFDYFMAGSDQIWNYKFSWRRFNDYFLKFAQEDKRIAISGSFGVEEVPEEWKEQFIDGLKGFSYISVREEAGQKIVKKLIEKDVPVLIDPTLMLTREEWIKVSRKPRVDCSKPYVLKYYLGDEKEEEKIDIWARKNGYEVYELLNQDKPELYSAGPGEFISLIQNASLVCSDSFHCIVFAIIFSRPFLVYARQGAENYMSSRLKTLLKKFNFEDRWKYLVSEDDYLKCDYSLVSERLKKEQSQFMDYLSIVLKSR